MHRHELDDMNMSKSIGKKVTCRIKCESFFVIFLRSRMSKNQTKNLITIETKYVTLNWSKQKDKKATIKRNC